MIKKFFVVFFILLFVFSHCNGKGSDSNEQKKTRKRLYTFRAIAGVSMGGGGAIMNGLLHHDMFDIVSSLGGITDTKYLLYMNRHFHLGGFCSMDTLLNILEQNNNSKDVLNDPDNHPDIFCGPVEGSLPWEHTQDYNHWFFFDNGGTFDRDSYIKLFEDVSLAWGNFAYYNPDSPYLPPGVDASYLELSYIERCENPVIIDNFYNREYNPDGSYPVITFCDGEEPVPDGEDNPDYYNLKGAYDPYYPDHNRPISTMLAVDYDKDGMRDYGEPVIYNSYERFDDCGIDGLCDPDEPGYDQDTNPDPNGDDYDQFLNPLGTEGNFVYDVGEPFLDYGLDGVDGTGDYGEGNGSFDYNPAVERFLSYDPGNIIKNMSDEDMFRIDIWIDAGIRDLFNFAVMADNLAGLISALGYDMRVYQDFKALVPDSVKFSKSNFFLNVDYRKLGKNVYLRYGNPDATEEDIMKGDGAHVGTPADAVARFMNLFFFVSSRWPEGDYIPNEQGGSSVEHLTFYSESLGAERNFTIILPPGYDDEKNSTKRYPVLYLMHGYGMSAKDMAGTAIFAWNYMQMENPKTPGKAYLQKFIIVLVEGQCCFRNKNTGELNCLDQELDESEGWYRTCNRGSFYVNHQDLDGNGLKYGDSVIDLIHYVDENFRTKTKKEVLVDENGIPFD